MESAAKARIAEPRRSRAARIGVSSWAGGERTSVSEGRRGWCDAARWEAQIATVVESPLTPASCMAARTAGAAMSLKKDIEQGVQFARDFELDGVRCFLPASFFHGPSW